jgi:adenylate cyclase
VNQVLVVDDNARNRAAMKRRLDSYGVPSAYAANGAEARQLAAEHRFRMIFMDITLPDSDDDGPSDYAGIRIAEDILCSSDEPKPVIIAVTAHALFKRRHAMLQAGFTDIIQKGREDFYERLRDCLRRHDLLPPVNPPAQRLPPAAAEDQVLPSQRTSTPVFTHASISSSICSPFNVERHPPADAPVSVEMPATLLAAMEVRDQSHAAEPLRLPLPELRPTPDVDTLRLSLIDDFQLLLSEASDLSQDMQQSILAEQLTELGKYLQEIVGKLTVDGPVVREESFSHWFINLINALPGDLHDLQDLSAQQGIAPHPQIVAWIDKVQQIVNEVRRRPQTSVQLTSRPHVSESPSAQVTDVPRTSHTPTRAWVLIVDDNFDARRDLERKSHQLGLGAISCDCATAALELLEKIVFDVCLVDIQLPDLSGHELIQRIRSQQRHLPIIVVSGNDDEDRVATAIDCGADDYLLKPASIGVLKARINSCLRQRQHRRIELERFLPSKVLESPINHEVLLEKPRYSDITVMVCDIRGFSRICESREPRDTIRWISDVMNELSTIILRNGGTIVDYVGDEIMAMWGSPIETEDHSASACQCALELQQAVCKLSERWYPTLNCDWDVGIGIHTGMAVCGNTGSKVRIKFGPLGNTVNLASRVQGTTRYLQSSILITGAVKRRISRSNVARRICWMRVNNLKEPVDLYELQDSGQVASRWLSQYEEALKCFEDSAGDVRKLNEALRRTAMLLSEKPEDGPARLLMKRIVEVSLGAGFDAVWTMPGK